MEAGRETSSSSGPCSLYRHSLVLQQRARVQKARSCCRAALLQPAESAHPRGSEYFGRHNLASTAGQKVLAYLTWDRCEILKKTQNTCFSDLSTTVRETRLRFMSAGMARPRPPGKPLSWSGLLPGSAGPRLFPRGTPAQAEAAPGLFPFRLAPRVWVRTGSSG